MNLDKGSWRFIVLFISTGAGFGYSPIASGTVGTFFPGIPLFLLLSKLLSPGWYIVSLIPVIAVSLYLCDAAEKALGKKDASPIVLDEVCGYMVTMILIPVNFYTVIAGALIFRFFDIVKLFPANWAQDKLPGGAGVLFDDVFAGVYANIILRLGIFLYAKGIIDIL